MVLLVLDTRNEKKIKCLLASWSKISEVAWQEQSSMGKEGPELVLTLVSLTYPLSFQGRG